MLDPNVKGAAEQRISLGTATFGLDYGITNQQGKLPLKDIEKIAAVDGVDAVFIGPSDLAASMGHLGNPLHKDVQAAIDDGFARLKAIGKPAGYLTGNEDEFRRRLADGVDFISFATDAVFIRNAAKSLVTRLKS